MKQEYLYKECYEILGAPNNCSWQELRKIYKKKVHKWHPDRFAEGSSEKKLADEKIKYLTSAYQQLSRYHKKHDCLPAIEPSRKAPTKPINTSVTPTKKNSPLKFNAKRAQIPPHKTSKPSLRLSSFVLAGIIAISLYWVLDTPDLEMDSAIYGDDKQTVSILEDSDDTILHHTATAHQHKPKATFGYGSKLVDVISAQGTPDKVEGDTWFYGHSEIYFVEGRVSSWHRDPQSPLNVGLNPTYRAP